MATHSSVLAWRIPGMGEPSGWPSMWSHRVRHDWSDLAAAVAAATSWTAAYLPYPSLSLGVWSNSCLESVMPSNHLILWRPLLLPPSIIPSIRVFSSESVLRIRWPKYWSLSFSMSPSNEYSGLISFKIDWIDLFAIQGTLESILQNHSLKASILQHSAFFLFIICLFF